jgi:hypothetical protein
MNRPGAAMTKAIHNALAFELAIYIPTHPAERSLPWRIAALTGKPFSDPDMDDLVQETEHWLGEIEASEGDA